MCGISGVINFDLMNLNSTEAQIAVEKMLLTQIHRGPDGFGICRINENTIFGHNRLSILDLELGKQPMFSANKQFVISYNGEIYNYLELRAELLNLGYEFNTHNSDTEVVLNAYAEWGTDSFSKFEGMFSFAIFDYKENVCFLVRDGFGIKPLYYSKVEGGIIFASEPKAIINSNLINLTINEDALVEYFHYRAPINDSAITNQIKKINPGSYLKYNLNTNKFELKQYFNLYTVDARSKINSFEQTFSNSVKKHLIADVPVCVFLSGGVDSSLIGYFASKFQEVEFFCLSTESEFDESIYAKEVAHNLKSKIHIKKIDANEFIGSLKEWIYYNDDPVSDPSALALFILSNEVYKKGFKVVLSGEGADEIFGGYFSYLRYYFSTFLSVRLLKFSVFRKLFNFIDYKLIDNIENKELGFLGNAHLTTFKQKERFIKKEYFDRILNLKNQIKSINKKLNTSSKINNALINDQFVRFPNDLLARTDRATMASSIEARVPFVNLDVVNYSRSLSPFDKVNPFLFSNKKVLKKFAASIFGRKIIYRRKRGFDLPIKNWLESDFKVKIQFFISLKRIPMIDYLEIDKAYNGGIKNFDVGFLWAWFLLENWYEYWIIENNKGIFIPDKHKNNIFYAELIKKYTNDKA
jgi:asparagine synthase (glutamine-hydrolysing)